MPIDFKNLNLSDLPRKGWRFLSRRFSQAATRFAAFCVLRGMLLPVCGLLEKIRPVRIGTIVTSRIGHLIVDSDHFVRRMDQGHLPKNGIYFFLTGEGPVANHRLLALVRRYMRVVRLPKSLLDFYRAWVEPELTKTPYYLSIWQKYDMYDIWGAKSRPVLAFSEEEEREGQTALRAMGIPEDAWFVCFYARDPAYLASHYKTSAEQWAYHNFRDCDIETFIPAMRYIKEQGGYAIRMGAIVQRPLSIQSDPQIIDYPSRYRSEFMDLYLSARCRFFVGIAGGLISIPAAFDIPILAVNAIPIDLSLLGKHTWLVPKKLRDRSTGKFIPYRQVIDRGLGRAVLLQNYEDQAVDVVNNTEEEILEATREYYEYLSGTRPHDLATQAKFKSTFKPTDLTWQTVATVPSFLIRQDPQLFGGGVDLPDEKLTDLTAWPASAWEWTDAGNPRK